LCAAARAFLCLDGSLVDEQDEDADQSKPTKTDFHDLLKAKGLRSKNRFKWFDRLLTTQYKRGEQGWQTSTTSGRRNESMEFSHRLYYKRGNAVAFAAKPSDFASCYVA